MKQDLLNQIRNIASTGQVTKQEALTAFDDGLRLSTNNYTPEVTKTHIGVKISEILYFIGAAIVLLGIVILVVQNWEAIGTPVRIIATLGGSIAAYVCGTLLNLYYKDLRKNSVAAFLIASILLPVGLGVTFHEAGMQVGTSSVLSLISFLSGAVAVGSFFIFGETIFVLFGVGFSTWFIYSLTTFLFGGNIFLGNIYFYQYLTAIIGLSYILLGYYFLSSRLNKLTGLLYGLGTIAILGPILTIGGFWDALYIGLVIGVIMGSIYLKSRIMLIVGFVFLSAYIIKISSEYFSGSIGWPLSLMIIGILIIFAGAYAVRLNKKYLTV